MTLFVGGGIWAFQRMKDGTGPPMLAVLGTVLAWYVGDVFYNDYPNNHAKLFDAEILSNAWWQVAWFLIVFLVATPALHHKINGRCAHQRSGVMQLFQHGVGDPLIQQQLNLLFRGAALLWGVLFLIAVIVLKSQVIYFLFPFLGHDASPWSHGQIGSGFDCFAILAVYLQLLAVTLFGVVAALATDSRFRRMALMFCLLSWPYFIFARTRNSMLAIVIPAVLCWVFLRLRGSFVKKGLILLMFFLMVNTWMKFVIANRSHMSIATAFRDKGLTGDKNTHNEGLNMFEELCWESTFIENGKYKVNWGERYFAELVNPIPRGLWPGKPFIGLDYAIARGHHVTGPNGTVDTTISTGMIGQGVVNFGRFLGPIASALLMSLWVVWLARLDLNIRALGRLPLYSLGIILTFNLGRDITLITLYPFVFGVMAIWWMDRHQPHLARPPEVSAPIRPAAGQPQPATRRQLPFSRHRTNGGFVKRTAGRSPHSSVNQ